MKPDVCRRVVGRLPSPHIQDNWQKSPWFQQRGMAPPFSLHSLLLQRGDTKEVHGGLSCEIVSDLCPNPFSHDWHVQPSCQRPNRLPPERRAFSPGEPARMRIRLSSKPFNHIVRVKPCQPAHSTAFPRDFHMGNCRNGTRGARFKVSKVSEFQIFETLKLFHLETLRSLQHATILPSALDCKDTDRFGARRSGRQKIEKRS